MQEIAPIKDIMSHSFQGTLTGNLYKTSLELLLLEVGQGTSILTLSSTLVELLAMACTVKTSILFLVSHDINLCHDLSFRKPRENDLLIMTALAELHLPLDDLRICNH